MEPTVSKVINGYLNMRRTPSTSGQLIMQIPNGSDLVVWIDENCPNGWFRAQRDANLGYVMSRYVAVTKDGGTCKVTTASGSLNIRQTPVSGATVLFTAARNSTLRLLEYTSVDGWYLVSNANGTGWAQSQYLTITAYPSASTIVYDRTGVTNDNVPIGYCAEYESTIGEIPYGTSLSLLSLTNGGRIWYKTAYNGIIGFVDSQYIYLT